MAGRVVAQAGSDGKFRVRSVATDEALGAIARGFAPSELVDLDLVDTSKSPTTIRLQLAGTGGGLTGQVTTPTGNPIAGALVAVGKTPRNVEWRGDDSFAEKWTPRVAVTDGEGLYEFVGLAPGTHPVAVRAAGFPYWLGETTIEAGVTSELPIQMDTGVTVKGTAYDDNNQPVAGAVVRAFPSAIDEIFLQGGQFDYDENTFGYPFTIAHEDGTYRLTGVAPGEIHLYCTRARSRRDGPVFRDSMVTSAEPGAVLDWDPVIAAGRSITGIITFRDGKPMANVFVSAVNEKTGKREVLITNQEGRFQFVRLEQGQYSLGVQLWKPPEGTPPAREEGRLAGSR